jgi:hypothetical protein
MGWAQRSKNRVGRHSEHLLAATQQQLKNELSLCAASGASPVTVQGGYALSDAEQDSPESLVVQDTPDLPVAHDACGHGRNLQAAAAHPLVSQTFCRHELYKNCAPKSRIAFISNLIDLINDLATPS